MHRWRKKPAVAGVGAGEAAAAAEVEAEAAGAVGAKLRLPMMYPRRMQGTSRTIRRRRLLPIRSRSRSARVSFTTRAKCTCTRLSGRARCTVHTRRRREGGDDVEPDELEEAVCHLPAMRGGRVLRYDTPDFTEWVANSSA